MVYHIIAEEVRVYKVVYEVEAETPEEAKELLLDGDLVHEEMVDVPDFETVEVNAVAEV